MITEVEKHYQMILDIVRDDIENSIHKIDPLSRLGERLNELECDLREVYNTLNFGEDILDGTPEWETFNALENVKDLLEVANRIFPYPAGG